ncbi:MAG: tyrosine-type recombinase/integrase, partial [Pseudomonadota bacterium]
PKDEKQASGTTLIHSQPSQVGQQPWLKIQSARWLNFESAPTAYAYSAFRDAIERAGITLQEGQLTHVLRHTFASHFMINGSNILVLQRSLGHANLTMTMRYAHLAPDHLQEVVKLNPLTALTVR